MIIVLLALRGKYLAMSIFKSMLFFLFFIFSLSLSLYLLIDTNTIQTKKKSDIGSN